MILPHFLSLSLSPCLSLPLCLSSFIFLSSHPHFLLQQREKRWSISSAGGEKNSSSVSRKSWWGEIEKARGSEGSEGRLLRVERSRGREIEGKGNTQEQHNRVSFLLGIKSGSSSALTTLLLDKMFLLQRLACKLDARLCFLYPFCLLSACYIGWIIIRLLSPPCGWKLAYTSQQTQPEVVNESQKRSHSALLGNIVIMCMSEFSVCVCECSYFHFLEEFISLPLHKHSRTRGRQRNLFSVIPQTSHLRGVFQSSQSVTRAISGRLSWGGADSNPVIDRLKRVEICRFIHLIFEGSWE